MVVILVVCTDFVVSIVCFFSKVTYMRVCIQEHKEVGQSIPQKLILVRLLQKQYWSFPASWTVDFLSSYAEIFYWLREKLYNWESHKMDCLWINFILFSLDFHILVKQNAYFWRGASILWLEFLGLTINWCCFCLVTVNILFYLLVLLMWWE